jgi:uncharacterized protein (TIGR03067 family)
MYRSIPMVLTVGLLTGGVGAKGPPAQPDVEKFQGTWTALSGERDGKAVPPEVLQKMKLVVKGNRYTFTTESGTEEGTFTLAATKKPKSVDVMPLSGPDKGKTVHGIYELESDQHKSCFAPAGKDRPKEFSSKPGSGNSLFVLKRAKP